MRVSTRPKSVISRGPREKASMQRLKGRKISIEPIDADDSNDNMLSRQRINLLRQRKVSRVIGAGHDI